MAITNLTSMGSDVGIKKNIENINIFGVAHQEMVEYVNETLRKLYIVPVTESLTANNTHSILRVLIDNSPITITIGEDIQPGTSLFIVDELGLSETDNIIINLNGFTANGSTSNIVIAKNFGYLELLCTSNNTFIIVREKLT